ncbi:unnamed protein product [Linum trigynum]|uniref:Uncharacterized protein n=1 Tax=Linum trigynum TaxID=586398 RepID=A0AAV2CDZ1_9ROSI
MGSEYSCSSSSGTRISVSPRIPEAYHLATVFGGPRIPVAELPVQFATPEEAVTDAASRTKTIAELLELHHRGASSDAKHFCSGIIKSVDSHTPCYKIQLTLRDVTNEAPFIVFGSCGNSLVFTSAPLLAQRYPHRAGQLPPELSALHGQYVKFEAKLPMIEANGVSTGEFRVLRVIPQQNHQIQAAAPLQIQSTVNASRISQPLLDIGHQPGPVSDVAALKQSSGQCSESSPSSSSKGKEKFSGLLLSGTCKPIFRVGQFVQEPQRLCFVASFFQSHGSVFINERVASPERKVVSEVHSTAPGVVPLNSTIPRKETGDSTNTAVGENVTIAYTGSLKSVANNSTAKLKDPTTVSMALGTSTGQDSSNISDSVAAGSGTPQSKVTASPSSIVPMSSSTPPFSSPSASLLVSPLAKVKVEKLDASELKSSNVDAQGSVPFSIGNSGSPQGKHVLLSLGSVGCNQQVKI